MEEELSSMMINRMMFTLMEAGIADLNPIKAKFQIIMNDYKILPKEEALVVWTEGKNEYYVKRFLLAKAVAGCTQRTLKSYKDYLYRSFALLGKDADTVSASDIQVYLAKLISSSSKTNADNHRRVLSSFYTWCQKEELILKNPMNKVESIKIRTKKKKAFTDTECELIRDNCRTCRERAIVEVLFSTWCRVSEIVSIKVSDMDYAAVEILGKGAKYRTVYLNARAQIAVNNYLAERKDSNPYLFPRMKDECRIGGKMGDIRRTAENWYKDPDKVDLLGSSGASTIEQIVRDIGKRAGVDNVHPHRFRRTGATLAMRHGMPIEQVSKLLGHEQLSTTQIYLDLDEDTLKNAHGKFVT